MSQLVLFLCRLRHLNGLASTYQSPFTPPHPDRLRLGNFFTRFLDVFQVQDKYLLSGSLGLFFLLLISPVLTLNILEEVREGFFISQEPVGLQDTPWLLYEGRKGIIMQVRN